MAERIDILPRGEHRYSVTVGETGATSVHNVFVPPGLIADLGIDPRAEESLVRISFEFLLERERPESILRRFDLDVIGRYFPEYRATVRAGWGTGRGQNGPPGPTDTPTSDR